MWAAPSAICQDSRTMLAHRSNRNTSRRSQELCRHFFREGKEVSGQWRVASSRRTGSKGNKPEAFAINLEGKYADWWRDWFRGEDRTFPSLRICRHNPTFQDAARHLDKPMRNI